VKTLLYLPKFYENNLQLQWRVERVAFIKGWSEFAQKSKMAVDHTTVFTPMDNGFDVRLYMYGTSVASMRWFTGLFGRCSL
jgi:hypothetical protein